MTFYTYIYTHKDLPILTEKKKAIAQGDFIGQSVSRAIGRASLDDAVTGVGAAAVGARRSLLLLLFSPFSTFLPAQFLTLLSRFLFNVIFTTMKKISISTSFFFIFHFLLRSFEDENRSSENCHVAELRWIIRIILY